MNEYIRYYKPWIILGLAILGAIIIYDEWTLHMWRLSSPGFMYSGQVGRQPGPPPIQPPDPYSVYDLATHGRPAQYYVRQYSYL